MVLRRLLILCAVSAAIFGCRAAPAPQHVGVKPNKNLRLLVRPYGIGVGDRLVFAAPGVPELHEREAAVREDGCVKLPLIGRMFAAGRTPGQLSAEVQEKLQRYYVAPQVAVSVSVHDSQQWYAESGNVRVARPYTGADAPGDALDVVYVQGLASTRVLRPNESGRLVPVDLGGLALEPGDVVRVSPLHVAQVETGGR